MVVVVVVEVDGGGGGAEAENSTLHGLLGEVTDRHLSSKRALRLLGGRYVLTPDTLLKMTAIVNRMRCGVPVILMGECGCGKTVLLRYLCAWLTVDLEILDVHGGTTEADILDAFRRAERRAGKGRRRGGRGAKIGENNNNGGTTTTTTTTTTMAMPKEDEEEEEEERRRRRRMAPLGGRSCSWTR